MQLNIVIEWKVHLKQMTDSVGNYNYKCMYD